MNYFLTGKIRRNGEAWGRFETPGKGERDRAMLTDLKSAKKVTGAKQVTRALKKKGGARAFWGPRAPPPRGGTPWGFSPGAGNRARGPGPPRPLDVPAASPWAARWPPWWTDPDFFRYSPHRLCPGRLEYKSIVIFEKGGTTCLRLISWFAREENRRPTSPTLLPCRRA